jgi:protein-S-isoprenylcysteine O-methyltransferase Ste14
MISRSSIFASLFFGLSGRHDRASQHHRWRHVRNLSDTDAGAPDTIQTCDLCGGDHRYILIGIQLEERDPVQQFGEQYCRYRQHATMLVQFPGRKFAGPN